MTLARIAAHLDPARELDDFQAAARALITHGLVTARFPQPGRLAQIRRFEEPLRNEFVRLCHWRLDVGRSSARLLRRPAELSQYRGARTVTASRRPWLPQTYASLCLVLAALEALGDQTTISQLAQGVVRLCTGDDTLPFDLTVHAHRRAFVDAVTWLEHRGLLTLLDGDTETFVAGVGDALYNVDRDAASRLLVSPPSTLAGLTGPELFLVDVYPPTPEGDTARIRHRVHRRLLTQAALYYDELPDDERDYARQRRTRIKAELGRLTGRILECRAEGQALIGLPQADPFPAGGAVAQAALLYGSELTGEAIQGGSFGAGADREIPADVADAAWARVLRAYAGRFTAEYRAEPTRLRSEATALLVRLDLLGRTSDDTITVRAALARYRAEVRLPETLDV